MKRRSKRCRLILKAGFYIVLMLVMIHPPLPLCNNTTSETKDADIILNSKVPYVAPVLSDHERVVNSFEELKDALSNNNGITTVYFGNHITMKPLGIRIHPSKTHIIVDGINPLDPEQQPHTLTDFSSATFVDVIYIDAAGPETLLIRNLTITGKNYYGPFSVVDSAAFSGLVITYQNVNYTGPQIVHHRTGLVRFVDCTIRISFENGGSINQEVAEVKDIIFEGKNVIYSETSVESVFWFPSGGSFRLAYGASVTLTSTNTSALYGIFRAGGSASTIDIEIGSRATLNITMTGVLAAAAYSALNSFSVLNEGAFYLTTSKNATETVMLMKGALTVGQDATFIINGYGSTSYAVISQTKGGITINKNATFHIIASNPYPRLISLQGQSFICHDPTSILLYNANRLIEAASSPGTVSVSAQQINYWSALSGGGIDATPEYSWKDFKIEGTLATGSTGNFTNLSGNSTVQDSSGNQPDITKFNMATARVLAFGRLELIVTTPTEQSTTVTGVTAPGATVRVSFSQQGSDFVLPDATANSEGIFHVNTEVPLNAYTVINIKSSAQYLYATTKVTVEEKGILEFSVPDRMDFWNTELSDTNNMAKRLEPDWHIVVSDTRGAGSEWSLFVRLIQPLTPSDNTKPVLTDALVFLNSSITPLTPEDLLIYHHVNTSDNEVSKIHWETDSGILIEIPTHIAYSEITYSAAIEWTLVDAP